MSDARAPRRWVAFAALAAAVVITDQLTKAWIQATLVPGQPAVEVVGEFVRLVYGRNTGGIFGLFGDSAMLLALGSSAVIAVIVVYMYREGHRAHWLLTVALGLLLGGAIGNLVDRVRFGYVIDWVDMGVGGLRWYTFNVADAAISMALVLLIAIAFAGDRLPTPDRAAAASRP